MLYLIILYFLILWQYKSSQNTNKICCLPAQPVVQNDSYRTNQCACMDALSQCGYEILWQNQAIKQSAMTR